MRDRKTRHCRTQHPRSQGCQAADNAQVSCACASLRPIPGKEAILPRASLCVWNLQEWYPCELGSSLRFSSFPHTAPQNFHDDSHQPRFIGIQTQSSPFLQRITATEFQEFVILAEALNGGSEGIHVPNGNNDPIYPIPHPGARIGRG